MPGADTMRRFITLPYRVVRVGLAAGAGLGLLVVAFGSPFVDAISSDGVGASGKSPYCTARTHD